LTLPLSALRLEWKKWRPYITCLSETRGKNPDTRISPREVVDQHLERIAELQPRLNAFVHMDVAGACEQAQASETAVMRGEPSGPLRAYR